MGKKSELVPQPGNGFVRIICPDCASEHIIFERVSSRVTCTICSRTLAEPTGGRARIFSKTMEPVK